MENNIYDVIIIGSGAAGYTAAIYACRAGLKTCIVSGEQIGGQLTTTTMIENFPSYPKGIDGNELMERMRDQVLELGCEIIEKLVVCTDFTNDKKSLILLDSPVLYGKSIIIASGASAKYPQNNIYNKFIETGGVSACAICDGFFYKDLDVIVIGGGDSACEEALYLSKICNSVTMLIRTDKFRASNIMVERVKSNAKISIAYNSEIETIIDEADTNEIRSIVLNNGATLKCDGIFVAIGHTPNTNYLLPKMSFGQHILLDEEGYVISEDTRTNIDGVFVAGDVTDKKYKQAITAAASGCMAALNVEKYLNHA